MMVVVVDISNSLWIKGASQQLPYNQGALISIMESHLYGCTLVVALCPVFTRPLSQATTTTTNLNYE